MEQTQVKSDVPFVGIKGPTTSASARSERQFTRVLRSKSSTAVKTNTTNSDVEKGHPQPSDSVPFLKLPEPETVQEGSNHKTDASQITHLRQLLFLHLELIQQQQEELQKKDREINQLKLDKEQVGACFMMIYCAGSVRVTLLFFSDCTKTPKTGSHKFTFREVSGDHENSNMAPIIGHVA